MKPTHQMTSDLLDLNAPEAEKDVLWVSGKPIGVEVHKGWVKIQIPFFAQKSPADLRPEEGIAPKLHTLWVRSYGSELDAQVIRLTVDLTNIDLPEDGNNPMLEMDTSMQPQPLDVRTTPDSWEIFDTSGRVRMRIPTISPSIHHWSDLIDAPQPSFEATIFPDGKTAVPFQAHDTFFPLQRESFSLAYVERAGQGDRVTFSLDARPDECFAGTGERFAPMNLSGRTLMLENNDALGVNNRRCYKNVPFYVSSRPYGLLVLTSSHLRLSLADISTRAAQGMVEDSLLDIFIIGGGNVEQIVHNYRRLTGFPQDVPFWSYGIWMSRMTYLSAEQTHQVADRLREEEFPCDILHIDTGWFDRDWTCDWKFSPRTFPDPPAYLAEMRRKGFRITLWQLPSVSADIDLYSTALANGYIAPRREQSFIGSNFGSKTPPGTIDFTNPAAVTWYQGMLADLLKMGVAAIKTDFGEVIDMQADYANLPANQLHNLYALLYQRAAFEITQQTTGEGLIWARAGWVGCQRYPVHWGGDSACTWDGLAGSIRGGLHLGMSGFAFWSHDVPGFHGLPNFMNSWPADDLYVRWTQMGVFTSHLRYHGAQPREPYEYPAVADLVRKWWRLRYALLPYLAEAGRQAVKSGYPVLRALIFQHGDDPVCWKIDDEFYCGSSLLVAPVLNSEGKRHVYLPEGKWRDLWTGKLIQGPIWLKDVVSPLEHIPVYAVDGARIQIYPERVACSDGMDLTKTVEITIDEHFNGLAHTILGQVTDLN